MHECLHPDFKLNVDALRATPQGYFIEGWCFSLSHKVERILCTDLHGNLLGDLQYRVFRGDVFEFYQRQQMSFLESGFRGEVKKPLKGEAIQVRAVVKGGEQFVVHTIELTKAASDPFQLSMTQRTDVIVVDNFYENPDEVRALALHEEFFEDKNYYKGVRTRNRFADEKIKKSFEKLIGRKITKWDYGTNGIFQYCVANEQLVYHMDTQQYAGVIYLTPNAPLESGTQFFRSKRTGFRSDIEIPEFHDGMSREAVVKKIFETGFYDRTQFDVVDTVANVYNRLVIWNARLIHAAGGYFGNTKENSRLFHLFFFDAEN